MLLQLLPISKSVQARAALMSQPFQGQLGGSSWCHVFWFASTLAVRTQSLRLQGMEGRTPEAPAAIIGKNKSL